MIVLFSKSSLPYDETRNKDLTLLLTVAREEIK